MQLTTLGGLRFMGAAFVRPKPLLLAAYVALEGPRDRRHLAELFWPDAEDPLNSLSAALKQLRQGAPGAVAADKQRVTGGVSCDAPLFLRASEAGRLEEALTLYRGPFLDGVHLAGWGAELEEWVYGTREFLAGHAREVLLRLGEAAAARGALARAAQHARAACELRGALELEPTQLQRLYPLLYATGHPHATALEREARSYGVTLAAPQEAEAAPLKRAAPCASPHLPRRGGSFVGRSLERAELEKHLLQEECRLVTLVGVAGIGKSRLALQVAQEMLGRAVFADGVFFVPLDARPSPQLIPVSIAEALPFTLQGSDDPFEQVARHLGTKHLLLILDNFEHLIAPSGAPQEARRRELAHVEAPPPETLDGALLVAALLARCPNLNVLVTSRERLNLEEVIMVLEGLLVPPDENGHPVEDSEALQLFALCAARARPGFALTQEERRHAAMSCRLVEGSPLGIELAAAWTRVLTCAEIAQEIEKNLDFLSSSTRDARDRHRSLRAAFEHSWRLLTPKEQEVLRRLSVFRGGFTREAAATVAGATIPTLAALVDKSLLRVTARGRYDRHPLLYQYTAEKLTEQPQERAQTRAAHGSFYFRFLQARKAQVNGEAQREGLLRLTEELENIRTAWGWAVAGSKLEELQGAVEPLVLFYDRQARYAEGISLLGMARASLSAADPRHQRALGNILVGQAFLYQWSSNYPQAVGLAQRGLALLRPLGESWGVILGIDTLGFVAAFTGNYAEGKRCWTEALALARAQDNTVKTAELLSMVGMSECWLGHQEAAKVYLDEALTLTPRLGKHTAVIYILLNLGFATIWSDPEGAQLAFRQSLDLARELGYRRHLPYLLYGLGWSLYHLGRYPEAHVFCKQAVEVAQESSNLFAKSMALTVLGRTTAALHDDTRAQAYFEQSLRLSSVTQSMFCVFVALAYLADWWIEQGQAEEAAELLGLILHHPTADFYSKDISRQVLKALRDKLPAEVLAAALQRGKSKPLEAMVEEILNSPPRTHAQTEV